MRSAMRVLPFLCLTAVFAFELGASREGGWVAIGIAPRAEAAAPALNACGCYRDSAGACFCGKKGGKCVCAGDCEPQGCEAKRAKEMQKEVDAEAKRAREAEKKQQDEQAQKAEAARKAEAPPEDQQVESGDDKAQEPDKKSADSTSRKSDDDDAGEAKGAKKKSRKSAKGGKPKPGKDDTGDKNEKGGGMEG